jgi:hypothetical protein
MLLERHVTYLYEEKRPDIRADGSECFSRTVVFFNLVYAKTFWGYVKSKKKKIMLNTD